MDLDFSKLSGKDLDALSSGRMRDLSDEALNMITALEKPEAEPAPTPTPSPAPKVQGGEEEKKGFGKYVPKWVTGFLEGAGEAVATAAPIVGGIAGGVAGSGAGPGGAVAGAALGFAGGEELARGIRRKPTGDPLTAAERVGKNVVTGAAAEMGGQLAGKVISKVGSKLSNLAEPTYGHAINTPATDKWKKLFPGQEGTAREIAVLTGLEEEVMPNKYGLRMATKKAEDMTRMITETVNRITKAHAVGAPWKGRTLRTAQTRTTDLLDKGLRKVRGEAAASGDFDAAAESVTKVANNVKRMGGVSQELNPDQLLALKRQFDSEIAWDKANPIINVKGQFSQKAKMGIRDAAMVRLEEMIPELKYLNKKTAAYIDLKEAIEHTLAREANKDIVGFSAKILALRNVGMAALDTVFRYHNNVARLAFAIRKGAEWKAKNSSRALIFGAAAHSGEKDVNSKPTTIRYNSSGARMVQ